MNQPKIERILKLMALLAGPRNYKIDELADELEITERTIYRYIDTFRSAHFSLVEQPGYAPRLTKINDSIKDFTNVVYFSDEEAFVINRLIDSIDPHNAMKAGLSKKLAAVLDSTNIEKYIDNKSIAKKVGILRDAIREKKVVELRDYVSSRAGTTMNVKIEPFKFTEDFSTIWGLDLKDETSKRYRLHRFSEVIPTDEPWTKAYAHHDSPMDDFHCYGDHLFHVKVRMNNAARNILIEEYPHTEEKIKSIGQYEIAGENDQAWEYESDCRDILGVGRFFLGMALNSEVVEGEELKEYLLNRADYIYDMYLPNNS